ncbi:MAG: sodium/solute symporter [Bacteroidaceae bacterium]|nr:sodium/solute symporter [Bacteroidaceae bacterium]
MRTFAEAFASSGFETLDFIILGIYVTLVVSLGMIISHNRADKENSASNYFLADNTLTWWAVGASLVAANISAEQFIGMAGTAYANGIATAAYEIMVAVILVVIGKFLLPIMMERQIITIPQFLRERYNDGVGLAFSIFWLFLYVFVNLTSVAWLGALAIEQIFDIQGMTCNVGFAIVSVRLCIVFGLFVIAGLYSIYGGQANVAWTDVLQVIFIVGGGLITMWVVLTEIGTAFDTSPLGTLRDIYKEITMDFGGTNHMHLIIQKSFNPEAFNNVPGIAAVVGAIMLTNIGYWAFNQYIIQKGLAAQNIEEARKGLLFAGVLKLIVPFIVVLPGLCAYYVYQLHPEMSESLGLVGSIDKPDYAYAWLIRNFTPSGIKGLALVALSAAILSSLASMLNSTSTIFTMDIYKKYINPSATDRQLVSMGRIVSIAALVIALIATRPLLGELDQAFNYVQENSALIYPGIIVVFGFGLFWKRASSKAAVWITIITLPLGILFKVFLPDAPFVIRTSYIFIIEVLIFILISLCSHQVEKAQMPDHATRHKLMRWAYILGGTGLLFILFAAVVMLMGKSTRMTAYLNDIGIQAFIFFGVLVGGNGFWLMSNALDRKTDPKALPLNLRLFHTTRQYTYGTIGIIIATLLFYITLW